MSTRHLRIAPTPLAVCLAAALGLGSASAPAGVGATAPISAGMSSTVMDFSLVDGSGLGRVRHFDALQGSEADLVPSTAPMAGRARPILLRGSHAPANATPKQEGPTPGSIVAVSNCNDSGSGSLRDAIAGASSGDTIDLTQLVCSTITMASGTIAFSQDNLTLHGPGQAKLTITGSEANPIARVLSDSATSGKLHVDNLTISNPAGGCLYSKPSLYLDHVGIVNCDAANGSVSVGAGILAAQFVDIHHSSISGNRLASTTGNVAGAGIYAHGVFIYDSSITRNHAYSKFNVYGGALFSVYEVNPKRAIIAHNEAVAGGNAFGGAMFAHRGVYATDVTIIDNMAIGANEAHGGAIFIDDFLLLYDSIVSYNLAYGKAHGGSGGAIVAARAGGYFATISYNSAVSGDVSYYANAGAIAASVGAHFGSSTISGNYASRNGGAIVSAEYTTLVQVTVSNNSAGYFCGGVFGGDDVLVYNSTIAFNSAGVDDLAGSPVAAGLHANGSGAMLHSTIIANNTADGAGSDFSATATSGEKNLITSPLSLVPADTISADPQLQRLADNGGPTLTHALLSSSPAIDNGTDTLTLSFDQRAEPYVRSYGGGVDIGAYERQGDGIIFRDGFDL